MSLFEQVTTVFQEQFHQAPTHQFRAPGRVNLIGEHTDYNDGFVLPCAINYETVIAASARDDDEIHVVAVDYGNETDQFVARQPIARHPQQMWSNYVRGVANSLMEQGKVLKGCNLVIAGNVPQGAGLSSSAALEVVVGTALNQLSGLGLDGKAIALNGQHAENHFVGCNCGIMDQLISAQGVVGHALVIDCRSLETRPVALPDALAVVIINSNVKRGLVDSEYNTRREQCEQAARFFGVPALRDLDLATFEAKAGGLDPLVAKRARHVITENQRTLDAAKALEDGDVATLSRLMAESHASMRDDFEITVPAIDTLVAMIDETLGEQGGVRMTGGGFGGCVVALVPKARVDEVRQNVAAEYETRTGIKESFYVCEPVQGAEIVSGYQPEQGAEACCG